MGAALLLLLLCAAWPRPRTLGVFLGVGLPLAAAGLLGFGVSVVRDLRRRRAL